MAGGVLYPSQGLTLYRVPDSQLLSAIFRAYNDWLADFCAPYPQREIVDRILDGVPDEEKRKIAGENVARLYHFN